jgi:signal transduction histidine kinase
MPSSRSLLHQERLEHTYRESCDMSRLTMDRLLLQRAVIDLRGVVEAAAETLAPRAEERGLRLHVSVPDDRVDVSGDEARLQQVFANLLSNAVRYTPRDGTIRVTLRVEGARAVAQIADTGQGITPDDLPRIFEPFSRGPGANAEGLGIGLTLVRGLVELHGGTVSAASPGPDRGSTFTVVLPVVTMKP